MNYELNKSYPLTDGFSLVYSMRLSEEKNEVTIVKLLNPDEAEVDVMVVKGGVTNADYTHEEVVGQFQGLLDEVKIMPVLTKGSISAYHVDIDALFDGLKMEMENLPDDEIIETEFSVSFKRLSGKELFSIPEFDGF